MYVIVWEYEVQVGREAEFDRAYAPDGPWASLFARAEGYLGTELLVSPETGRRVTLDRWRSRAAFEQFLAVHAEAYAALDRSLDALTESEARLGGFEAV